MNSKKLVCIIVIIMFISAVYPRPLTDAEKIEKYMNQAKEAFERGNNKEALGRYRAVLKIDSNVADAYNNIGLIQIKQSRYSQARTSIQKALAIHKDKPIYLANLGLAYLKQNNLEQAEEVLRRAVKKDNNLYEGFIRLAVIAQKKENYSLALDYAKRAGELNQDSYKPYKIKAEVYTIQKEVGKAVTAYLVAQDRAPKKKNLYLACAELCLKEGRKKRARKQFLKALQLDENDHTLQLRLAKILKNDGEYGDAFYHFKHLFEKGPVSIRDRAVYGVALCLYRLEKYEDAKDYAEKAVDLKPANTDYRVLLSDIYESLGKYAEAAEIMPAGEDEKDAGTYLKLGIKHEKAGNYKRAAVFYKRGIGADPGNGAFYLKLGNMYHEMEMEKPEDTRDLNKPRAVYSEALDKLEDVPERGKIAYNLGRLYAIDENAEEALSCYVEAAKSEPLMVKAYIGTISAYVGTKPWTDWKDITVWAVILVVFFSLYIIRRRRLKRKLEEHMEHNEKEE